MKSTIVNLETKNSTIGDRLAIGYSRQLFEKIAVRSCDIKRVFKLLFNLNPNKKSYSRTRRKLEKLNGVIKCGLSKERIPRLQIVLRSCLISKTVQEDTELFDEQVVSYTRLDTWFGNGRLAFCACRVLFSIHALQRFIQRTSIDYKNQLERSVDLEGITCLSALVDDTLLGSDTNAYAPSNKFIGAWPAEVTQSEAENGWPDTSAGDLPKIRTLSVRTFFSPDEMSPQVYLQWNGDPRCNFLQTA
tara:strand:- start:110 stop:847 length:738 start_codon:yes stop_codon:yes gene_type:complete